MLNFIIKAVVILKLISLAGCVPIVKESSNATANPVKTSPLAVLNGEKYDNPLTVGPVVFLEKKQIELMIAGNVKFQTDLMALPAKFVKLQLIKDDKALQEIQSDARGHFSFRGSFQEGEYLIKAKSDSQQVGFKVSVLNADVLDLVLLIDKK